MRPTPGPRLQEEVGTPGGERFSSKVFVGGLATTVSSEELSEFFAPYGTITDAVAMKQRGFGFVEFSEPEAAQAVVDAGPHVLHGKETSVKLAASRESMAESRSSSEAGASASGPPSLPNKIFVGGLPRQTDTVQLSEYFSTWGELSDAIVMPSRGFGFVAFHDVEAMHAAMAEEHSIDGQPITLKLADGQRPAARGVAGPVSHAATPAPRNSGWANGWAAPVKKVFVGGLPRDMATTELEEYFSWFGALVDCVVMKDRGFGFVEFTDAGPVDAVMGEPNHFIRGAKVSLRLADGKGGGKGGMASHPPQPPHPEAAPEPHWRQPQPPLQAGWGQPPSHVRWGPPPGGGAPQSDWASQPASGRASYGKGPSWGPDREYWSDPMEHGSQSHGYRGGSAAWAGGHGQGHGQGSSKIFVRGLPETYTTEELESYFSFYGPISDAKAMTGRGFGFITFANAHSVDGAVRDKHEIDGYRLSVKLADGLKGPSKGSAPY